MLLLLIQVCMVTISLSADCRDRNKWPFAPSSIWNMPIGSNAEFIEANIFNGSNQHPYPNDFYGDVNFYYTVDESSPLFPWYNQGHWGSPCDSDSYCKVTGNLLGHIRFPKNTTITNFCNNNAAAILQPDNVTLLQMQPIYHCSNDGPILAFDWCIHNNVSILGNGTYGCHGSSHLSSIGGSIRLGELITNKSDYTTMKHSLQLEFFAHEYYYGGYKYPCYQWPALGCDNYHHDNSSKLVYGGMDEYFRPGTLLAIPNNNDNINILKNLKTEPGKKIMWSFMNYGGYLGDDTAANRGTFGIENGVNQEFQNEYGQPFNAKPGSTFYDDLLKIFQALKIVKNSNENNIGGGGKPMQPLAPPVCN
eukprot:260524_1